MSVNITCFYDLSSPWTRLAFHNLPKLLHSQDVDIHWRPFLVGGVFNAVNPSVYAGREQADSAKSRLAWVWLKEWADQAGVVMNFPSPHHPVRSVHAMRFCCALEDDQAKLVRFSEAAFEAYFGDEQNLDEPKVLVDVANSVGLDGAQLAEASGQTHIKDKLRANTQEAIDRGAFGSPTIFVSDKYMYFGNDQLPLVKQRVIAEGG